MTAPMAVQEVQQLEEDKELAGVGLAFYAQVFVLKVWLAWRGMRGRAFHSHHHRRSLPPIGRGTR